MKEQWKQGLQWGGVIWLAWLSLSSIAWLIDSVHTRPDVATLIKAIGWTVAFALAWTRWSRLGVAIGIAAHGYAGLFIDPPFIERAAYQVAKSSTSSLAFIDGDEIAPGATFKECGAGRSTVIRFSNPTGKSFPLRSPGDEGHRSRMDRLRQDDVERARRTPIEERARQTLAMMATGIRLQRVALRRRFPEAADDEIERRLRAWLARNG